MTINRLIEILEIAKTKIGGDKTITFWQSTEDNLSIVPRYDSDEFNIDHLITNDRSKIEMQIFSVRS